MKICSKQLNLLTNHSSYINKAKHNTQTTSVIDKLKEVMESGKLTGGQKNLPKANQVNFKKLIENGSEED
jgi:hypothetical protein